MTLQELFSRWGQVPTLTREELKMHMWDSWGEIRRGFPPVQDSILVEYPAGADQVFIDTIMEVHTEWEEREWVRQIQGTPLVGTVTGRLSARTPNLSNLPRPGRREVPQRPLIESAPDWGLSQFAETVQRDLQRLQTLNQAMVQQAMGVSAVDLGLPIPPTEENALQRRTGGGFEAIMSAALTPEEVRRLQRTANFGLAYGMRPEQVAASLRDQAEQVRRAAQEMAQAVMPSDYSELETRVLAQSIGLEVPENPTREVEDFVELEEGEVLDIVARSTTTKTRKAARAKTTARADPIYVWGLQSSKPRNGGEFITYEVRLEEDGSLRCNCPGWIFKKKDAERGCKHTHEVEVEAKDFFQRNKKGEQLPTVALSTEQLTRLKTNKKTESKVGIFGRIIDFE